MKKLFMLGLLSAALFSVQAESEMLKGYKSNDFAVICSENFNSGSNGWTISADFSVSLICVKPQVPMNLSFRS
mgnify:CR=1 FL=1